ncbi:hypothetical protein DB778_24395, partial [Xanthomonas perforans]
SRRRLAPDRACIVGGDDRARAHIAAAIQKRVRSWRRRRSAASSACDVQSGASLRHDIGSSSVTRAHDA